MVPLLYGAGLRLMESCRLRVKDVCLYRLQLTIRQGKGSKNPPSCCPNPCQSRSRTSWPSASRTQPGPPSWPGLYLTAQCVGEEVAKRSLGTELAVPGRLPATLTGPTLWQHRTISRLPRFRPTSRQRSGAVAGMNEPVHQSHFAHSFAMHLLESGSDIRTVCSVAPLACSAHSIKSSRPPSLPADCHSPQEPEHYQGSVSHFLR